MPLVVLVVQCAVTFALVRSVGTSQFHTGSAASPLLGFASGGVFALVSLGLTVGALLLVYEGTHDFALTLGYFVVHWIEGYLLSFVLTAAVLASLGLHTSVTEGTIDAPGSTVSAGPSQTVENGQGIYLQIQGHTLSVALPVELRTHGRLVTTEPSAVYVQCLPVHGPGFSLPPQTKPGAAPVAWQLSSRQLSLRTCYVTVRLSQNGVYEGTNASRFNLLPGRTRKR